MRDRCCRAPHFRKETEAVHTSFPVTTEMQFVSAIHAAISVPMPVLDPFLLPLISCQAIVRAEP